MKRIIKAGNFLTKFFGVQIVRSTQDQFTMEAGFQRIARHDFNIKSVIDIGASDGKWSKMAMHFLPEARYLALEPLDERSASLKTLRQKKTNFDYVLCVAGESNNNKVVLNVSDDLDGSTVGGRDGEQRIVQERTIDSIVSEKKLPGPFLLKFDTHGYELPILNGAKQTLLETNIIIMEVYNFRITQTSLRFHEMCEYLERFGFRCYDMASPMLRCHDKAFWQMDLFFCRKDSKIFSHNEYR